jgi:hypothetical protein
MHLGDLVQFSGFVFPVGMELSGGSEVASQFDGFSQNESVTIVLLRSMSCTAFLVSS